MCLGKNLETELPSLKNEKSKPASARNPPKRPSSEISSSTDGCIDWNDVRNENNSVDKKEYRKNEDRDPATGTLLVPSRTVRGDMERSLSRNGGEFTEEEARWDWERKRNGEKFQMDVNQFFFREMEQMKQKQDDLVEALHTLQLENKKLTDEVDKLKSNQNELALDVRRHLVVPGTAYGGMELPMVVYNLKENPPTVLTANKIFCDLLGYRMDDVVGLEWKDFIAAEYVDKTIRLMRGGCLQTNQFQTDQCYRHKNGSYFFTVDTCVIFRDHIMVVTVQLPSTAFRTRSLHDTYAAPVYNSSGYVVGTSGAVQPSQYQHHHQPYHGCYHPSAGYISPHTHAHPSPYGSSPYGAAHAAPSAPQISASPPSHMLTYSPLHQPESSDKLFPSTSTTIPPNIGLPHISVLDSSTASSPNIGANQEADAHSASPNKPLSSPPINVPHEGYSTSPPLLPFGDLPSSPERQSMDDVGPSLNFDVSLPMDLSSSPMAVSGERDSISPNMPPPFHAPVDMEATSNPGNEEEIEASKWVEAMLRKVEKGDVDPYLGESFSLGQ